MFSPGGTAVVSWARAIRGSEELALGAGDGRAPSTARSRTEVDLVPHERTEAPRYFTKQKNQAATRHTPLSPIACALNNALLYKESPNELWRAPDCLQIVRFFLHVTTSRVRAELFPGCISALSQPASSAQQLPVSNQ